MALNSTIYNFDITLSDVDRNVYTTFALRVARHPSETEEYLLTRVLAYCLEYTEGIAFSKGLADPEEPAILVRDLTGALRSWIEIGAPDADRVHKASKASPRVAIYTHKDPTLLTKAWAGTRIHRIEEIELYGLDPTFLRDLATHLDRRVTFALSVTERHLYLALGSETLSSTVQRVVPLP